MKRARLGRIAANILIIVIVLAIAAPMAAEALGAADIDALNEQVEQLYGQGKSAEATVIAEQALTLAEQVLGKEHPDTLRSVSNLAGLYYAKGRYGEAEPLNKRVIEARERVLGKEHPDTLVSLNNLALLYQTQGRYSEAEPLYRRAFEAQERVLGKEHPDTLVSLSNLAALYRGQGRYSEAEALYRRALEASERVLGKEHPETLQSVNNLAEIYRAQGRYSEAEPLYKRGLEARERVLGKEHPETLGSMNNLAALYQAQGRYGEAEPLNKRALEAQERVLGKEHPNTLVSLNNLAELYQSQGRYGEAEPLNKRALEAQERVLGKEHPNTLVSLNRTAALYDAQNRYGEAEPLYKRVLEARERVLGKEHPDTLVSVNNLAALYRAQGRYGEAEPLYRRVLEARERVLGKEHPDTLGSVNNLALLYHYQGRYSEAEPLYKRVLEASERVPGKEHPRTLTIVSNLAGLYISQGRYGEAEPLYKRALEFRERVLGKEHPDTLGSVNDLAALYDHQGRYSEAEPLYKRALESRERVLGKEHPDTLGSVGSLAELYRAQGRYSEAEPLFKRALEAQERVLGKGHPDTLVSLSNLAALYWGQGRYSEAEPLYRRALEASERVLGKEHPKTLLTVNNMAMLYNDQGRDAEAEQLYKRVLDASERVLGKEHPNTLVSLNNLAALYFAQRDWSRAGDFWRRSTAAIAARTKRGALETGRAVTGKKKSDAEQDSFQFRQLVKAVYRLSPEGRTPDTLASREMFLTAQWAAGSQAAQSLAQMAARGATGDPALALLARERQDKRAEWQKRDGLRNIWLGQAPDKRDAKAELENNASLAAIDGRITEIDKRLTAKFPNYAVLASSAPLSVDDVQAQLRADEALVLFLDTPEWKPTPEETFIWVVTKTDLRWVHSELGTPALGREIATLRCGLDADAWSGDGWQKCRDLTNTEPARDKLGDIIVAKLPFDLARARALYKSLFGEAEGLIKGKSLIIVPSGPLTQLPFHVLVTALSNDVPSGERVYQAGLLGASLEDLTPDAKQSLKIPPERGVRIVKLISSGAAELAGLKPDDILLSINGEDFGTTQKVVDAIRARAPGAKVQLRVLRADAELMVTATLGSQTIREWIPRLFAEAEGQHIAWLARDHALTVLPAVSSLKALRQVSRQSAATKPMIGFGNPLLDGDQGDPRYADYYKKRAALARENQSCPQTPARTPMQRLASLFGLRRSVAPMAVRGLADVALLKAQLPLPETRDELCAVARDLKADPGEIRLGARATEREVKALSASGALAQYRIVHFATHGVLAGQLDPKSEPGLILTPPEMASETDDGYLTASEIAALKLDADWVILSACNTAAGASTDAEALSGLSRAFFYAQARALLVSHWSVDSDATVKLVTGAFNQITRDKRVGRSEALRRSMLTLIDNGKPEEAHPSYWAPFVLVGDGAAVQ